MEEKEKKGRGRRGEGGEVPHSLSRHSLCMCEKVLCVVIVGRGNGGDCKREEQEFE